MHRIFHPIFQKLFFPKFQGRDNRNMRCEHQPKGIRTPAPAAIGGRMRKNINAAFHRDSHTTIVSGMRKDRPVQAMSFLRDSLNDRSRHINDTMSCR